MRRAVVVTTVLTQATTATIRIRLDPSFPHVIRAIHTPLAEDPCFPILGK
jgi:hypothetical protein